MKLSPPLNTTVPTLIHTSSVPQRHGESPPPRHCPTCFPCLPSDHCGDPTSVRPPQHRRLLRHLHRPVRGDHGVGARRIAQLGRPRLIWPLGQAGATRPWANFRPCTVNQFLISGILFPIKISRILFKFLKFIENEIKLRKYEINFFRIIWSRSLQWV
jgi:hypothetical protein